MPTYKFDPTPNGSISHIFKLFLSEEEAYTIPGIIIEDEALAEWMLADAGRTYNTYYYDYSTETITARPANPSTISALTLSADSIASITISSLPIPSTITIDDNTYAITEEDSGEFEFSTPLKGEYLIKIESFPYLPKEFMVTAT